MTKLGGISGKKAIKKFQKLGYQVVRQKGSHARLKNLENKTYKSITVPIHRELKKNKTTLL